MNLLTFSGGKCELQVGERAPRAVSLEVHARSQNRKVTWEAGKGLLAFNVLQDGPRMEDSPWFAPLAEAWISDLATQLDLDAPLVMGVPGRLFPALVPFWRRWLVEERGLTCLFLHSDLCLAACIPPGAEGPCTVSDAGVPRRRLRVETEGNVMRLAGVSRDEGEATCVGSVAQGARQLWQWMQAGGPCVGYQWRLQWMLCQPGLTAPLAHHSPDPGAFRVVWEAQAEGPDPPALEVCVGLSDHPGERWRLASVLPHDDALVCAYDGTAVEVAGRRVPGPAMTG